jgi:AcrR family transcriptional regulator
VGSDTRDRILSAAALLFQEHGYHATGVSDILDAAGVNSGSLYHFFDGKEALLEAVVEHHLQRLDQTIFGPAEAAHHDPVERILIVVGHYRRSLLGSDFTRGCAVGRMALEIGDDEPRVRVLVERYFTAWTGHVERWLDTAAEGPTGTMDPSAAARLVLAATQGAIMLARAAASIEPFDAAVAELRNHLELVMRRPRRPPTVAPPSSAERARTASDEERPPHTPGWRSW